MNWFFDRLKAVTAKCCDRLSALLLCVIPPVMQVTQTANFQNGEFEAAHCRTAGNAGYASRKLSERRI